MRRLTEIALWLALATGVAGVAWAGLAPLGAEPDSALPVAATGRRVPAPALADSVAAAVVARDLFRLDRRAAAVRYDPARGAAGVMAMPLAPPKPQLRLRGIVMTDTARALIEGFPGIEGGRFVRRGDVIAGLRVAGVSAAQIRVVGMDTTWVLTMERRGP